MAYKNRLALQSQQRSREPREKEDVTQIHRSRFNENAFSRVQTLYSNNAGSIQAQELAIEFSDRKSSPAMFSESPRENLNNKIDFTPYENNTAL